MAQFKTLFALMALCVLSMAVSAQQAQGSHPSQVGSNQGRVAQDGGEGGDDRALWTSCDYTGTTTLSCLDCNRRVICKPVGGIVKYCGNPNKPYCNNGICSSVPAAGCA